MSSTSSGERVARPYHLTVMACRHTLQIHLSPWDRVFMDELDRRLQALLQFRALALAAAAPHLPWLPHHRAISSRWGSVAGATWLFTATTPVCSPVQDVHAEIILHVKHQTVTLGTHCDLCCWC